MANAEISTRHPNFKNLLGHRYGKLLVVEFDRRENKRTFWICRCDCGRVHTVGAENLHAGTTQSCGCGQHPARHGKSHSKIHKIWTGILQRCTNIKNPAYVNYGGRGITVCDEWRNSFDAFYRDMGDPPTKTHTLDRINNDGGYCKQNCRWATRLQQSNNRRGRHVINFNGQSMTLHQWANHVGISPKTLICRVNKLRWPIEKALTTPITSKLKQRISAPKSP